MSRVTTAEAATPGAGRPADVVDPRAPRFGQGITTLGLAAGIALQEPAFVYAITAILVVAAVSRWRVDLYSFLWRRLAIRAVGEPAEREPAAPHRFAKLVGATFTAVASGLLVLGTASGTGLLVTGGFLVAALVAVLAGIAAVLDICVGCRMYEQVSYFRRLGWV